MSTIDDWEAERDAYLKSFGANVKRIRKEKGLSQMDLERVTGLHRTEIGRIEGAKVEPRLMTLHILAKGLSATIGELIDGVPVPVHRKPSPQEQRKGKST